MSPHFRRALTMTPSLRFLALVVLVSFAGCALPLGMPPAASVARFVRTDWDADAKPRGKVSATAAGLYIVPVQGGGNSGQVFTPEAAARFDLGSAYQLAPTVSTTLVGLDAQLLLVRGPRASLGLLHGVGGGLAFGTSGSGSSPSSSGAVYATFHAGLMGQFHAGPGTAYVSARYAYGTGVPFGSGLLGNAFTPSHYVLGNLGYLVRLGGALSIAPELGIGWMKQVPSSNTAGSSDILAIAPSVTVAADF